MSAILSTIGQLVAKVPDWVSAFLSLMITTEVDNIEGVEQTITRISFLGLACIVVPLVGLGIGIIKRLVSVRA